MATRRKPVAATNMLRMHNKSAGLPHTRREFLRSAAATGAVVMGSALFGKTPASSTPQARPNIVFFLGEGARWDESSIAGNSVLRTPHIDRIAREGVLFRNAFCINSLCLPARATILSGLYSHTSGAVDNQHSKVPEKFPIVTDLIRDGGAMAERGAHAAVLLVPVVLRATCSIRPSAALGG